MGRGLRQKRCGNDVELRPREVFSHEIAQALGTDAPLNALVEVLKRRMDAGESRQWLLAEMDIERVRLRDEGRGADEEQLMDAMDCLVGFCAPHLRI